MQSTLFTSISGCVIFQEVLQLFLQLQGFNYKVISATWLQQPHTKQLTAAITDNWDGKLGENSARQNRFYTSAF